MRGDLLIQFFLGIPIFGDRLDDQVAGLQLLQSLVVVRHIDIDILTPGDERAWIRSSKPVNRLPNSRIRLPGCRGTPEQHDRNTRIRQMRCDAQPHHAGTQDRRFADEEVF